VFFGGGTPSLLAPEQLGAILCEIPLAPDAEVTVECNPDSVGDAKLAGYRGRGVDRLSFGVQSMRPHVLRELGRTHDPDSVAAAVRAARGAGFERVNLDVIYGTPGESLDDWRATLTGVLALEPDHVSAYALTVEPGTPLARSIAAGTRAAPDDDDQADKYVVADELLTGAGFDWYEISNWARPGQECRHNELYWHGGDYVGIGCAAHGYTGGRRWWNVRTPERYVEGIERATGTEAASERLDDAQRSDERVALELRTRRGVLLDRARTAVAQELAGLGLLEADGPRWSLTTRGRLLASEVTVRLLAAHPVSDPLALGTLEC
jgi:oxygen-independent coproporphyrinogen-3 oxidase